jgi:hypothetical protein
MIILESPNTWRSRVCSHEARDSKAQTPTSSALVLVPGLELKVHWKTMWSLILMTPPTPLSCPCNWVAPSNQHIGMSSFKIDGIRLGTTTCYKSLGLRNQPRVLCKTECKEEQPLSKVTLLRSSHICQQMRDGNIRQIVFLFNQPSKHEDMVESIHVEPNQESKCLDQTNPYVVEFCFPKLTT